MVRTSPMSLTILFFVLQLFAWSSRVLLASEKINNCISTTSRPIMMKIGAVLDLDSLVGKQQKIAMEIAVQEFNSLSCSKLDLNIQNSRGISARAIASVMDLTQSMRVLAIIGTITHNEATLASELNYTINKVPTLSLTSPTARTKLLSPQLPHFIQIGDDVRIHMQCVAAIVGEFRWKKVTVIYELNNWLSSDPGMLLDLTYALRQVGSEIDNHLALPSLSSLSDPKSNIENELKKLKSKSNRVFLIVHSSLELANILFEKAKQIGLMEKGSVWVISDGVVGLLDSVNPSAISNMQGVIGFKTNFMEVSETFRQFKFKFQRNFASEFPEEEKINPSFFALQLYDATWAIAQAAKESQGKFTPEQLFKNYLSRNDKLQQSPTFNIINVIGKSYRDLALWSPKLGFSKNLITQQLTEVNTDTTSTKVLSTVYWPGGLQFVPKGSTRSTEERTLQIGVPANGVFRQFVNVTHDQNTNNTSITGFSIDVFKAVVNTLPYDLKYTFVPFNGSYDEMVEQVHNKTLDAAVGDTAIMAYRYHLVDFTQPYIESGLDMVVKEKSAKSKETWIFLDVFTKEMWLMIVALHIFVGFVIWFIERRHNAELKGLGSMLWFLVSVIFYAHREPITSPLARTVLAPWLFVILIATSTFTASLTSMMTVSQLEPSVLDIQTLQERNSPVGCNGNSFIVKYLIDILKFKPENIKKINSIGDYPAAFQNKDIEAAFFVTPHAKIFLAKYSCKGLIKAGSTFKLGGFGFVFPKGSTLATDLSEALLKVIEKRETEQLEKDMLLIGGNANCSPSESKAKGRSSTGFQPFLGLFLICSSVAILALLYNMICVFKISVEIFSSYMHVTLTKLKSMWRCTTTCFTWSCSRLQSGSMRSISTATVTRNAEETVISDQQSTMNVELIDVVLAAHAS
ncbi:glutamate receptor 2.5-like [Glycine soja]|uniref:Glutamate receptor n=1 Tax=Glycine soja TaxID=3848 RepID=A0A445GEY0_GLYSO|nr:glutamate receptor 2.5-like [Glycine soja]RZB59826.1 Glutamate receptor 2.5 isoform B [Glycine soja]